MMFAWSCSMDLDYLTDRAVQDGGAASVLGSRKMVGNYIKLLEVLGVNIHKEVEVFKCQKGFKYGNSQKEIANMCCLIPTYVGGQRRKILCYIIGDNAPILIGRPLMREFGIAVDYDDNMARYRVGEWHEAELGPKGEYIVRLAADLEELRNNEDEQILMPDDFTDHIDTTDQLPLSAVLDDEDIIATTTNPWLQHVFRWLHQPHQLNHLPAIQQTLAHTNIRWNPTTMTLTKQDAHHRIRTIRLAWDGNNTIRSWIHDHWRTKLYHTEQRVWKPRRRHDPTIAIGLRLPTPPPNQLLAMHSHTPAQSSTSTPQYQVTMATGTNAWQSAKRHNTPEIVCFCGRTRPSMPHLLWNCPHTRQAKTHLAPTLRQPTNMCEERLLAATILPDITPLHPTDNIPHPPAALLSWIKDWVHQAREAQTPIVIATDGGAKHDCATWAVAMGDDTMAEPIHGEDTTAFAAELTAIIMFAEGLTQLGPHPDLPIVPPQVVRDNVNPGDVVLIPIILAVDSKSVLQLLMGHPPTQRHRCWQAFQTARTQLLTHGYHLLIQWTPAHGRMPEWRPAVGHADELRQLNHAADSAATCVLQHELHRIQAWLTTKRHAEDWAARR